MPHSPASHLSTPAAVTGDAPLMAHGPEFGGRADFAWNDIGWQTCLDAPEYIVIGGATAVDTSRFGGGYEGTTPCTAPRGRA